MLISLLLAVVQGLQIVHSASVDLPLPTRQLEWKDVNFLSISDTHGWLLGHQHATWPEPNYSGDYGDFASFVKHMRSIADEKGVDLLVVDAGDHHDGSGLVSSSAESAAAADDIFGMVPYDVLAIGNHEMYYWSTVKELYDHRERWGGRYLTSNANITIWEYGQAISTPIGDRFAKFESKQGRQVTAFGVIFNFQAHGANLTVQAPALMVREQWFLDAMEDAPDYFVLVGHMPVRGDESAEWGPLFDTIRAKHPTTPIYIFGGHTHVRDCTQYDDHSIAIVPGRYMETVTFASSSLPDGKHPQRPLDIARRYLDANVRSYMYHTNTTKETFDLPIGRNITLALRNLATNLNISQPLGYAPQDLFLSRYPYGHPSCILTEWANKVLLQTVKDALRPETRLIITQCGSIRFNLFQGIFDRNDELTLSPFANAFLYTTLPVNLSRRLTDEMNRAGASKLVSSQSRTMQEDDEHVELVYNQWLAAQAQSIPAMDSWDRQVVMGDAIYKDKEGLTMGYLTRDACQGKGDDIEHYPIPHSYDQPDFISTPFPDDLQDDQTIDVVVMDFALDDFLVAVKVLDPRSDLKVDDMKTYADGIKINAIWGMYAGMNWQAGL